MITHCCLTRPIWLPGGASTVTSIAQQSQPAQQCHPAQHLKSRVTLITSLKIRNNSYAFRVEMVYIGILISGKSGKL